MVTLLSDLLQRGQAQPLGGRDEKFAAEQNARAAVGAEAYYRTMMVGGPDSWNVRDTHMADTLDRLMKHHEARLGRGTERLLHDGLTEDAALFVFPRDASGWLAEERAHRAIGVVYRPEAERWGNYVPTRIGRRYDCLLWFDETRALEPLGGVHPQGEEMETWPYGG